MIGLLERGKVGTINETDCTGLLLRKGYFVYNLILSN